MKMKLALSLLWPALFVNVPAFAEEAVVEEIIVTATKREQSIQDVPIAITALDGEYLANRGITNVAELQQAVPSLGVYSNASNSNGGTFRIRGYGTTGNNPGLESSVGSFLDGVYRSRAGQLFSSLYDIQRIEVLRGPQGTLFGKNTSAGAISVISNSPEFDFGSGANLSYGNYNNYEFDGYATGPITSELAFRVAVDAQLRDGWIDGSLLEFDPDAGSFADPLEEEYANKDRYSIRGQVIYDLNESLEVRAIVDYRKQDEACCAGGYSTLAVNEDGDPVGPNFILSVIRGEELALQAEDREVSLNYAPLEEIEDYGASLQFTYDLGGQTELVAIGAYREHSAVRGQDVDFSDVDILAPYTQDETFTNASGEVRLATSLGSFDLLFGAYAYSEKIDLQGGIDLGSDGVDYINRLLTATAQPGSVLVTPFIAPGDDLMAFTEDYDVETKGYAFFTHNMWNINDAWVLGVGVRYSKEDKEGTALINEAEVGEDAANPAACTSAIAPFQDVVTYGLKTICDNYSWEATTDEAEWSGSATLSYQASDSLNIYASYARGYKSGGLNLDREAVSDLVGPPAPNPGTGGVVSEVVERGNERPTFDPEYTQSYELGWKGLSETGSTMFNGSIFYTEIEDFQLNTFTGTGYVISNVGEAYSSGLEVELEHVIYEGVSFTAGLTWTPFTQYAVSLESDGLIDANGGVNEDGTTYPQDITVALEGQRLTHAPEHQASLGIDIIRPITANLEVMLGANASYKSEHNTGSDLDANKVQEAYTLYNAQVGLTTRDRAFSAVLWGTNLSDEVYNSVTIDTFLQAGNYTSFYGAPRMFGLTLSASL